MPNLGLAVLYLCFSVMSSFPQARANTEIVNFAASPGRDVSLPLIDWPVLRYGAAERLWKVQPAPLHTPPESVCAQWSGFPTKSCPNEIWVILDLDNQEWQYYSKFTLRLSWPASSPADFSIQIYSPESLAEFISERNASFRNTDNILQSATRRKYARVRVVDTGVLTPSHSIRNAIVDPVSFILLLEPLYFGVLPASTLPVLLFLIPVVSFAGFVLAPAINRYLSIVAAQARTEIQAASAADKRK